MFAEERHLQLDAAEEGAEQAHHAKKLYTTQVLHNEFLAHIRDAIKCGTGQNQEVSQ